MNVKKFDNLNLIHINIYTKINNPTLGTSGLTQQLYI